MAEHAAADARLLSLARRGWVVGAVGLAACAVGFFTAHDHFFRAWLMAWLFWLGIGTGCLAVLFLHHVTGGGWGVGVRRLLEAGARTVPVVILLFLPVLAGLHNLYVWTRPEVVAADHVLAAKAAYLNVPFFLVRLAVYFTVWIALAHLGTKWSLQQDRTRTFEDSRRARSLGGPGLILYMLTMTFASIDLVMSLDPHWFSTMFGPLFAVGQVLSAFAFVILMAVRLSAEKPLRGHIAPAALYDLGNLLLAFTMLWAYLAFSQLLIIWAGNLPEEIPWYLDRLRNGWGSVGLLLVLLQFAVPFLFLIFRGTKRRPGLLAAVASVVVLMRLVDQFWTVIPGGAHQGPMSLHWLDVAAALGMGGVWAAVFYTQLRGRWGVPAHDYHTAMQAGEALEHGRA